MRKRFFTLSCLLAMTLAASAELQRDADGYYLLGTAADLVEFSSLVNGGQSSSNAKLVADIDMSSVENFVPIGLFADDQYLSEGFIQKEYRGAFDGQGHIISNLKVTMDDPYETGFFSRVQNGSVQNLGIVGATIVCNTSKRTAVLAGAGVNEPNIRNVFVLGCSISSESSEVGALCGLRYGSTNAANCFTDYEKIFGDGVTGNNCYAGVSEEDQKSGKICYQLNHKAGSVIYYQTLGESGDPYPTFDTTHGIVYQVTDEDCGGNPKGEPVFSNENTGHRDDHQYQDGFCIVCGAWDSNYLEPVDGAFQIATVGQLKWFAHYANTVDASANAVLTADIEGYDGPQIGTTVYQGTFDGQYHKLTVNLSASQCGGLFRQLGGTLKNITIGGTIQMSANMCGGAVADLCGGTVENVTSLTHIIGQRVGDSAYAGVVGRTMNVHGAVIRNCVFAGTIDGEAATCGGGILGWAAAQVSISNCLVYGQMNMGESGGNMIARNPANVTYSNCYYVTPYGEIPAAATQVTAEQLTSGEVAFMLNQGVEGTPIWNQLIGSDEYPTPDPTRAIIYIINKTWGNAVDDDMFRDFQSRVVSAEGEYISTVVAQFAAADAYETAVNEKLGNAATIEEMMTAWETEVKPLYEALVASEKAYADYKAKVAQVLGYLEENPTLQNQKRTELESYLTENIEPSTLYPNGSALYILDAREMGTAAIIAETAKIDAMYQEALTFAPTSGTDLTRLLVNPDFTDGFEGWQGKTGTATGVSETSPIRAAECYNTTMDMYQTLTDLQNGIYEFQVSGAYRPYPGDDPVSLNYAPVLYANGNQNYFQTLIEDAIPSDQAIDGYNCCIEGTTPDFLIYDDEGNESYVPQGIVGFSNAFRVNRYFNSVLCQVTDGTLTVGIRVPESEYQPVHLGFGNLKLIYHGTLDEASEGLDRVLESQSARANTLVNVYQPSSGGDYAWYPNFPQDIKNRLSQAVSAVETADQNQKLELVKTFSDLFDEVFEGKKAYVSLMRQSDKLNDMLGDLIAMMNDDQLTEVTDLYDQLTGMYNDGSVSTEDALKDYISTLSFTLKPVDGVFQIGSALQLALFTNYVNTEDNTADAILTADIEGYEGPQIGTYSMNYMGTFDGQGHKITYTLSRSQLGGLFFQLGGTVKNLQVGGTVYMENNMCGGLVADLCGGTLENIVCSTNIIGNRSGDSAYSGLVSRTMNRSGSLIKNCLILTKIDAANATCGAGIVGWANVPVTIQNCLVIAEMNMLPSGGNMIARYPTAANVSLSNCYYVTPYAEIPDGATQVTDEQVAGGEACFLLNGSVDVTNWYQAVGTDVYPLPLPGSVVYAHPAEGFSCDGKPVGETSYDNIQGSEPRQPHEYVGGFCVNCGKVQDDFVPQNADGSYEIATAEQLEWFAKRVNAGELSLNAVLTADIDNYTGPVMGDANNRYAGTFDGHFHKLTVNLETTSAIWGLFRTLSGTVKNLHLDGTMATSTKQAGTVAGFVYGGTIENVISTVALTTGHSGDAGTGGLTATVNNNTTVRNCVFAGSITGANAHSCAGLTGWIGSNSHLEISNCLVVGDLNVLENGGNVITRNPASATITNCYYLKPYSAIPETATQVTEDQLKSGEVCYLLNGDQTNIQWSQTLGEEDCPKPFPGLVVKQAQDGTYYNEVVGIDKVAGNRTDVIYDLSGRRVEKAVKGIYIMNGKKVLVK